MGDVSEPIATQLMKMGCHWTVTPEWLRQRSDQVVPQELEEAWRERDEAVKERDAAMKVIEQLQKSLGVAVHERDEAQQTSRRLQKKLSEADQRLALVEEEREVVCRGMARLEEQLHDHSGHQEQLL